MNAFTISLMYLAYVLFALAAVFQVYLLWLGWHSFTLHPELTAAETAKKAKLKKYRWYPTVLVAIAFLLMIFVALRNCE